MRGAFRRSKRLFHFLAGCGLPARFPGYVTFAIVLCLFRPTPARGDSPSSEVAGHSAIHDPLSEKIDLVDGNDIRFQRLSAGTGLSQTRVAWVVQDKVGFMWFGTQYGLNRFDGYKSKVFKHEPGRPDSLSCVYVRSLFVDHAGTLWVGCDRFLDRFEPATETFNIIASTQRFLMNSPLPLTASVRITREPCGWRQPRGYTGLIPPAAEPHDMLIILMIPAALQQRASMLRPKTGRGDCGWQAPTGWTSWTPEPEKWCAVPRFMPRSAQFHEDKFGIFWMTGSDSSCALASWNLETDSGEMSFHQLQPEGDSAQSRHFRNNRNPQWHDVVEFHGRPAEVRSNSQSGHSVSQQSSR